MVLGLWDNGGTFRYDGTFFTIDAPELDPVTERGLHMKPLQLPHPPISVAASTSQSASGRA